jgi:hypothetical protein
MKFKHISQIELLRYLTIPRANLHKYKCEKKLHIEVVQRLIPLCIDGSLHALWFHPANEAIKSKEHGLGFNLLLKMMGKLPGVPDLIFGWKGGMGCIELKHDKNSLSPSQKIFAKWCAEFHIPFVVARSWEAVENTLKEWEVLKNERKIH